MTEFQALIAEHGITVTTTYLPYDPSEIPTHEASGRDFVHSDVMNLPLMWNYKVIIGSQSHTGTYSQGSGFCKYPPRLEGIEIPKQWPVYGHSGPVSHVRWLMMQFYTARLMGEYKNPPCDDSYGFGIKRALSKYPQPDPEPDHIIFSLLLDAGCVTGRTPGEFMSEFGYEDFDEGFAAYQACQDTERFWIRQLGPAKYEELLDAACESDM